MCFAVAECVIEVGDGLGALCEGGGGFADGVDDWVAVFADVDGDGGA